MSQVCVSLRNVTKQDVLLWLNICVQKPLNFKLSDENLIKLVSRSSGRLRSLTLVNCPRITDDGLLRIVNTNPFINKLCLPGCRGLTVNGVIRAVKTLSEHHHSLKHLQINGIYDVEKRDFEIPHNYLLMNQSNQALDQVQKPIFYHDYRTKFRYGDEDDGRMIDVEICPKCEEVKMVFDCPREKLMNHCRGCKECIQRCEECGKCVEFGEQEDAVCLDPLCLDCWIQLRKCSFCNKPYCNQHTHLQRAIGSYSEWVCEVCHDKDRKSVV